MAGKHTAGPWVAFEIAPDDPSWGACEIWPAAASAERESDDSTARPVATMVCGVENARLIAAAPELLGQHEANLADLWLLRTAIQAGDPVQEILIRVADIERRTEAAIARATQPLPPPNEESK